MKVLQIATSVVSQSASYRIHQGLLNQNIESKMLVTKPSIQDKSVIYNNEIKKKLKKKYLACWKI